MKRSGFYIKYTKNLAREVRLFYGFHFGEHSVEITRQDELAFANFLERAAKMIRERRQKGAGRNG
jgi:hypothetical protein